MQVRQTDIEKYKIINTKKTASSNEELAVFIIGYF